MRDEPDRKREGLRSTETPAADRASHNKQGRWPGRLGRLAAERGAEVRQRGRARRGSRGSSGTASSGIGKPGRESAQTGTSNRSASARRRMRLPGGRSAADWVFPEAVAATGTATNWSRDEASPARGKGKAPSPRAAKGQLVSCTSNKPCTRIRKGKSLHRSLDHFYQSSTSHGQSETSFQP